MNKYTTDPDRVSPKTGILLLLVFFVASAMCLTGNTYKLNFLVGLGVMMLGFFPAYGIYDALKKGVVQNYRYIRKIYRRDQNPIAFWTRVGLLGLALLFFLGIGFAIVLGWLAPLSPSHR